ncbi:4Fe-4S ferredoxin [Rhodococcus sp. AD45-ID]|uniref:FAD-dependent oxidoreductase n=1 Tax=unclassified Rhodococcus (in: high G+C Gram-positive bacteria) TaxID=192944 RepID=UPI0005D4376F|nr:MULTISPECIES: FAD-dependent oxidoreductase [unclassified Rhodococcus (in: high G+C Gram-positive bacteria)]KJF24535.1 NADPH-ferredoxin reductase fprA [Rhodococcus sp. AD45]PSR42816.1 4Fe-4S ferredoxin [Rhodococcus sp. AD45-ID]
MPHVVTQSCCSDASCVYACPVNCIHPTPDEPDFLTAEMLHIDPQACVDCGACVSACPVDAIVPESKLAEPQRVFLSINADFYKEQRPRPLLAKVIPAATIDQGRPPLRVAIVGSGPSAMYAADELLTQPGVQVNVFDRLPVPYGLVRAGVAPDHQKTKQVTRLFDKIAAQRGFEFYLNVEIGKHLTHDELLENHHAVLYAVGASSDRGLGIPGADLPGTASATDFVAWYNGHPDHVDDVFDLSHRRAVIIGNGNVALDVARILTADPEKLAGTDISAHALAALRKSRIEEVVIVGRRGIAQSAFTVPEFTGLLALPDIELSVGPDDMVLDPITEKADSLPHAVEQKLRLLEALKNRDHVEVGSKRITLRYLLTPTEISGEDRVSGIEFERNTLVDADGTVRIEPTGDTETIDAGLVLTSIGYRGVPIAGVPFDERASVIPNEGGRVSDAPGVYATGWIKRGPSGFIGTNKSCAQETVRMLVDDFNHGRLRTPAPDTAALDRLVRARQNGVVDRAGWHAIDKAEVDRGVAHGRVREKILDQGEVSSIVGAAGQVKPPRRKLWKASH